MKRTVIGLGFCAIAAVLMVGLVGCSSSPASSFPNKDISYIVAWAQGGAADATARALADATGPILGKQLIVKNVVGGSGAVGTAELVKAKADGYTLAFQSGATVAIAPHLGQEVGFKTYEDFEIINMVNMQPYIWVVKADSPWKSLKEIADDAKKRPGQITFSFSGVGTGGHLTMEAFTKTQGFKLKIVPFQSAAEGVTNLLGGHVDSSLAIPVDVITHIKEGRLRPLGAFSNFPGMEAIPGLKSWKDQGIDFAMWNWNCNVAPKGTPKDVIQKLQAAFKKGMEDKNFVQFSEKGMLPIDYKSPEDTLKVWKSDYEIMGNMVKELGLAK